jgi:hypothetical protein
MEPESSLPHSQVPATRFVCEYFVTKIRFYGEKLLAPRPTPEQEDHPLPAIRS